MSSFFRLGFLLLLSNIASVYASDIPKCDPIVEAHEKLLKIQSEITRIRAGNSGNFHLTALEDDFNKLNELSDIRRDYVNGSCDLALQILMSLYGSIDGQLKTLRKTLYKQKSEDGNATLTKIIETIKKKKFLEAAMNLSELDEWAQIPKIVQEVYANSEENFNLVIGLAEAAPLPELRFSVLRSLHSQFQKIGLKDPFNLLSFVYAIRDLSRHVTNMPEIETGAESIIEGYLDTLKTSASLYLFEALNASDHEHNSKVQVFCSILYDFSPAAFDEVMKRVVGFSYGRIEIEKILANFFSLTDEAQTISAVSELLKKIRQSEKRGNDHALQVASHLNRLRNRDVFSSLDKNTKEAFEKVVMNLPTCARNAFFSPIVCLRSRATYTYLIAADSTKDRHNILLEAPIYNGSLRGEVSSAAKWSVEKFGDYLSFRFRNNKFTNEYLHVAAEKQSADKHFVLSRPLSNKTEDQSVFRIDVDAEFCYLRSEKFNEYLIASEVMYKNGDGSTYVLSTKPDTTLQAVFQLVEC